MAKNFPYFKFIATEWLTGDIVFESLEVQGLFINVCALYWQRDGILSVDDIIKRYKRVDLLKPLNPNFFTILNGFIKINFLDEQLEEAGHVSATNSLNGKKGAEARAKKRTAKKEKTSKEINIAFEFFWDSYDKKVGKPEKMEKKWNELTDTERFKAMNYIPGYKQAEPNKKYRKNVETFLNNKSWNDELIPSKEQKSITVKTVASDLT